MPQAELILVRRVLMNLDDPQMSKMNAINPVRSRYAIRDLTLFSILISRDLLIGKKPSTILESAVLIETSSTKNEAKDIARVISGKRAKSP